MTDNILSDLDHKRIKSKPIMCAVNGHQSYPLIFAYIAKSQSSKRLLCMQCFKEDNVIDKKQLIELAKLQLDYGQNQLQKHRADLLGQLVKYIKTLNDEKLQRIAELNQQMQCYKEDFLRVLEQTQETLINAISHQIEYRIEMVTQNMQRQIDVKVPEEIIDQTIYTSHQHNEILEQKLDEKFTTKGLVLYDRFYRQCHDLQRVDYMLNSRITIDSTTISQILLSIQEKVRSVMSLVVIPDVQKHQQLVASQILTQPLDTMNNLNQQSEGLNVSKNQIINVFCKEDNWIDQFKQQLFNHDWFSQCGVRQITGDWKNPITLELNLNQLELYPSKDNQNKSQLIFVKCINEKSKEEPSLQPIFDLLAKSQSNDDNNNENTSLILSKDMQIIPHKLNLTTNAQIQKVFESLRNSKYLIKNLGISLRSRDMDEKQLILICADFINIVENIKYLNIDLSVNKLGDSCIKHLKPVFQVSSNMRILTLNFEQNGLGHHNCQLLSQCLMQLKTLVFLHLNLNSNKVSDLGCNNLAGALKHLSNLTHLGLSFNNNNIGEVGTKSLIHSLSQLPTLIHLLVQFDNNHIGSKGFPTTFEYLGALKNLISMNLSYRNNQIQNTQLQLLEQMLLNYQNLDEFNLDLAQNNLGDLGLQKISQSIAPKKFLKSLHLNFGNNSITRLGMHSLGQALYQLGQLEDLFLNFEDNSLESSGCHHLSYGLKNKVRLKSLELNLKNLNNVSEKAFQSIMEEGQQMIELQYLTMVMCNNNIEDINMQEIMSALQKYQLLEELKIDLSHTLITNIAIGGIGQMISQMPYLKNFEINLMGNKINDEGLNKLVQSICKVKSLTKLTLILRNTNSSSLTFNQLKSQLQFIKDLKIYI